MAIPAIAGGVGAAAIWREHTGQAEELSVDLRQALYGIPRWALFLADYNIAAGTLPPGWLPPEWTWDPTVNGRNIQAPFLLGNPLGFQLFETKDGRLVAPTGIYPHHFIGFLALIGAGPDHQQITERIRAFDLAELEHIVGEAGMIMGIHRTAAECVAHDAKLVLRGADLVQTSFLEKVQALKKKVMIFLTSAKLSGKTKVVVSGIIIASTFAGTLDVSHAAKHYHPHSIYNYVDRQWSTDRKAGGVTLRMPYYPPGTILNARQSTKSPNMSEVRVGNAVLYIYQKSGGYKFTLGTKEDSVVIGESGVKIRLPNGIIIGSNGTIIEP
jgi:hypothetical protein